jgi:hypothetical protein
MQVIHRKSHFYSSLIFLAPVLLVSLGIVFWKGISTVDFGDGQDYLRSAESIFAPTGYLREGLTWPFFRPPGYPFFIACVWKIFGIESIAVLKLFNVAFHLISTFLIFKILVRKNRQSTAIVGALIFGFNPFALLPLTEIQTEPLTLFLFLMFCYLISKHSSKLHLVSISLIAVFLVAVRPEYIVIVLGICFIILISKNRSRISIIRVAFVFVLLTTSLTWWGNQNKAATGSFIPLTNAANYLLWNGSTEYIYNNYEISLKYDSKFNSTQYIAIQNDIKAKIEKWGPRYKEGGLGAQSKFWLTAYVENIEDNPLRFVVKTIEKAAIFWRPFLNPKSHGITTSLVSLVILLPLTLGMGFILFRGRRQMFNDLFVRAYLVGFLGLTIVHAFQMPDQRYKFPLLIPFASILVAPTLSSWIFYLWKKMKLNLFFIKDSSN